VFESAGACSFWLSFDWPAVGVKCGFSQKAIVLIALLTDFFAWANQFGVLSFFPSPEVNQD
jgi:hypothetical protein